MIEIKNVTFTYEDIDNKGKGIYDINLNIEKGECIVLMGESGCGKTTFTRLINGLIPHFYKGELVGNVAINGQDIATSPIAETAKIVGSVFQNPRTQFFNVDTTSELAFGCENQGMEVKEILSRIDETVELFSLSNLMDRSIFELSGGEKQRIACGSAYATYPEVIVLDEPSSSLDAYSIHKLRHVIEILKDLGKTIIISEHRLHYLRDVADRFIYMNKGKISKIFVHDEFMALGNEEVNNMGIRTLNLSKLKGRKYEGYNRNHGIDIKDLSFQRGGNTVLDIPKLRLHQDEVVALIGHNGAGKTTFAHCLCGLSKCQGTISVDNKSLSEKERIKKSFLVMQDVNSQLFSASVEEEITLNVEMIRSNNQGNLAIDKNEVLALLNLSHEKESHPMALSGGQKQRVAIASAVMAGKDILIYDEPTSGLDYSNMRNMCNLIAKMEPYTYATLIITHDIELILGSCHRVIHLERGGVKDTYPLDEEGIKKVKEYFISTLGREHYDFNNMQQQ